MPTLDDVLTAVTAQSTTVDSVKELVAGLRQQVADVLSGTTVPPAVQEKIDAIFAAVTESETDLQAALSANVEG